MTLVAVALALGGCVYGFPAHLTPEIAPTEIDPGSRAGATVEVTVDSHAPPSEFYAASAYQALRETGVFGEVGPAGSVVGTPPDAQLYLLFAVERGAIRYPRQLLTTLTLGIVPSWVKARVGVRAALHTPSGQHGLYWIHDEITFVTWLPLALIMLPDAGWGQLTGRGTYFDRFCRNLVRNIVAQAQQDGFLPQREARPLD